MAGADDREQPDSGPVLRCAWAKVNLYLHVTGRRPDGYHELDSLIVFAGLADSLTLQAAEALSLEVAGPFAAAVPPGPENLVLRAARALAEALEIAPAAAIRLEKRLPVAAGLGGGSADAAAALDGLCRLWGRSPSRSRLEEIALDLGADVPVCLYGRPAFVGGVGERVERAPPLPPAWLVLVNPGVPLATAEVFAARTGDFSVSCRWRETLPDVQALADELAALENDLEAPARALAPEVDAVLARLAETPGVLLARLSGSGATCFGLCASAEAARAAAAALAAEQPGWWVAAAPLLHGPLDRLRAD